MHQLLDTVATVWEHEKIYKVKLVSIYCIHVHKFLESFQFVESRFNLRSSTSHSRHCDILENEDLTVSDRQHYSLTYGVNRRALLDSLLYFNVSSGALIPDVMHDILEGALPYEVKCMLQVFFF